MVEWAGEKLGEEFIEKLLSEKENLLLMILSKNVTS